MSKEMEKQKNNLSRILEINKKISSYSNLRDILENILFFARELFGSVGGSLLLAEEGRYLRFEVVHGDGKEKLEGLRIPVDKGIAGYIFSTKTPVISNDTEKDPRFFDQIDKISGIKTQKILGVPLIRDNEAIGVIEVVNKADNSDFTEEDLELLSVFAEQAVIAINNAVLLKKIEDRARELEFLYEISNSVVSSFQNTREFFDRVIGIVNSITTGKRISIMLFDEKTNSLRILSSMGIREEVVRSVSVEVDDASKPSAIAFRKGEPVVVFDVDRDETFGPNRRDRYRGNSFMVFPIKTHSGTMGVLNITEMDKTRKIEKEEIELLQLIANQIGYACESIRMYEREVERRALEREIEVMMKIQMGMLPTRFDLTSKLDVCFYVQPYRMVGGDFYDFFKISDNEVWFFLGDVSGKGLPASIFMAAVKSTVRAISFEFREPKRVLDVSNRILCSFSEMAMFSTLFFGVIDLDNMVLRFSNAGHGQQFLLRDRRVIPLRTKGIPLGINVDAVYSQEELSLEKGDIIVVYSDGVTEAVDENENMFGEERVIEIVRANHHLSSLEIKNVLLESVQNFKVDNPNYDDDMAVGIVKVL